MKIKNLLPIALLCAGTLCSTSCQDDNMDPPPADTCDTDGLTYSNYAEEIINQSCATAGCHNDNAQANGTFQMSDYATTSLAVGFNRIIGAINHQSGFSNMPKGEEKLDDCTIDKLTAWINDGAPE